MSYAPPPFNPWMGYYPTPELKSKSEIDQTIKALKKMRRFYEDEKKIEDEKKKKHEGKKSAFSGVEMFFILTLSSPFIGIGYVYVLMFAMRQLQYMMR
jgi:hypothetical protein